MVKTWNVAVGHSVRFRSFEPRIWLITTWSRLTINTLLQKYSKLETWNFKACLPSIGNEVERILQFRWVNRILILLWNHQSIALNLGLTKNCERSGYITRFLLFTILIDLLFITNILGFSRDAIEIAWHEASVATCRHWNWWFTSINKESRADKIGAWVCANWSRHVPCCWTHVYLRS